MSDNSTPRWGLLPGALLISIVLPAVALIPVTVSKSLAGEYDYQISEILLVFSLYFSIGVATFTITTLVQKEGVWGEALAGGQAGLVSIVTLFALYGAGVMCSRRLDSPPAHFFWLLLMFSSFLAWEFALAHIVRANRHLESTVKKEKVREIGEMVFYVDLPTLFSFSMFGIFIFLNPDFSEEQRHLLLVGASSIHLFYSSIVFLAVNSELLFSGHDIKDLMLSSRGSARGEGPTPD